MVLKGLIVIVSEWGGIIGLSRSRLLGRDWGLGKSGELGRGWGDWTSSRSQFSSSGWLAVNDNSCVNIMSALLFTALK
jgi:hypothetical protein